MSNKKVTLRGVECEDTKDIFRQLKKRGFDSWLEDGGHGTYRICAFINGYNFVISIKDVMKYSKGINRRSFKWTVFDNIDDLVIATLSKKESAPTSKQLAYIKNLSDKLCIEYVEPETVSDACDLIDKLKKELDGVGKSSDMKNSLATKLRDLGINASGGDIEIIPNTVHRNNVDAIKWKVNAYFSKTSATASSNTKSELTIDGYEIKVNTDWQYDEAINKFRKQYNF